MTPIYALPLISPIVTAGDPWSLRDTDLLFQMREDHNPITAVTCSVADLRIDHVGIFCHDAAGQAVVLEAIPEEGVTETPLDRFLARNVNPYDNPYVIVGRVWMDYDREETLRRARSFLGLPYDNEFLPDNDKIYCSELVLLSFVDSLGIPVFELIPMTFHDETGRVTDYWRNYYQRLGMEVPEDVAGSNPSELASRNCVEIIGRMF